MNAQLPVPVQSPLHPVKLDPELGVAVSVTCVPLVNVSTQSAPLPLKQLIPLPVTVPLPVPVRLTVSAY